MESLKLIRDEAKQLRGQVVEWNGKIVPASIEYLSKLIPEENDSFNKNLLLEQIASEYLRAKLHDEYLEILRTLAFGEYGDT